MQELQAALAPIRVNVTIHQAGIDETQTVTVPGQGLREGLLGCTWPHCFDYMDCSPYSIVWGASGCQWRTTQHVSPSEHDLHVSMVPRKAFDGIVSAVRQGHCLQILNKPVNLITSH